MTAALACGVAAGLLHLAGFALYARRVRRGEVVPHGISWSMRCYGALVHFLIFAEIGMPVAILIQPAVSGLCAVAITAFALVRGAWLRPTRTDRWILAVDVVLLAVFLTLRQFQPDPGNDLLLQAVVAVTVIRKIVPYLPVVATIAVTPEVERSGAWAIWACGYAMLFAAAALSEMGPVYAVYPVAVCGAHLAICALILRGKPTRSFEAPRGRTRLDAGRPRRAAIRIDAFPPYFT